MNIHIPPAALEAGARAILHAIIYDIEPDVRANGLTDEEHALIARAAFVAMVEAWPGMSHAHNEEGEIKDWATWYSLPWHRAESSNGIILPIPTQEKPDDER